MDFLRIIVENIVDYRSISRIALRNGVANIGEGAIQNENMLHSLLWQSPKRVP